MENKEIGKQLVEFSQKDGLSVRGALEDLFPYIFAVSKRLSTRKVSEWLEESHGIKISYSSVAKALKNSDGYIQATASEFYGSSLVLDKSLIDQNCNGLDVLGSSQLFGLLVTDDILDSDSNEFVSSVVNDLKETWFPLPKKYREKCLEVMREKKLQQETKLREEKIENS